MYKKYNYKHIVVSEENFRKLQNLGKAGESFNDVIDRILWRLGNE